VTLMTKTSLLVPLSVSDAVIFPFTAITLRPPLPVTVVGLLTPPSVRVAVRACAWADAR
jgi:hypothetical protein